MFTRNMRRHAGIRAVHGKVQRLSHEEQQRQKKDEKAESEKLRDYISVYGVREFLSRTYTGDIYAFGETFTRQETLGMLDKNGTFRNYVSNKWRAENERTHEWIPCTYLNMVVKKAIVADDFRYIWLANLMRSPTQDILFKPDASIRVTAGDRKRRVAIQAHAGGLNLRDGPANDPLGGLIAYGPLQAGSPLQGGSPEFHNALIAALKDTNSPDDLIDRFKEVFQRFCWNGNFPVNGIVAADELWPYYSEHGNVVTLWDPSRAVPRKIDYADDAYNRISADFNQWGQAALGRARRNTDL